MQRQGLGENLRVLEKARRGIVGRLMADSIVVSVLRLPAFPSDTFLAVVVASARGR